MFRVVIIKIIKPLGGVANAPLPPPQGPILSFETQSLMSDDSSTIMIIYAINPKI